MEFFVIWISFITIILVGAASPGPDFIVVVRNALSGSQRAGIFTAFGIGLGICVHVSYSMLGVAAIIAQSVLLYNVIKYVGAAYLVYIGYKALRSKGFEGKNVFQNTDTPVSKNTRTEDFKAIRDGLLTNLLNPKATLFFLALLPQFIGPGVPLTKQLILASSAGLSAFIWFTIVSIMLNRRVIKSAYIRSSKWIDRVCGGLLISLGVKLASSRALAP